VIALVLSSSVGCEGILGPWFSESGDATSRVFMADSETNDSGVPIASIAEQADFEDAVVTLQRMSNSFVRDRAWQHSGVNEPGDLHAAKCHLVLGMIRGNNQRRPAASLHSPANIVM